MSAATATVDVEKFGRKWPPVNMPGRNGSRKSPPVNMPARTGSELGTGNYVVTVGFGTPRRNFSVIFDTGSDVSWIQCAPCTDCYAQAEEPVFDPKASFTYATLLCKSVDCDRLYSSSCSANNSCRYSVQYGDQSETVGTFGRDVLTLSATAALPRFLFGCGEANHGLFGRTAGLLGLGRGNVSLVSQAARKYGAVFSYCLPSRSSETGYLTIGRSNSSNISYTPMIRNQSFPSFYFADMVHTESLDQSPMANSIPLLFLSLALCFLLPSPSLAQFSLGLQPLLSERRLGYRSQCQLERLAALEPTRRVPSEAGFTEYFDQFHEQLQCAGVVAYRRTIQPRGLVLPYYSNAPRLVYIVQGRGVSGTVIPGCPESFQSLRQGFEQQLEEEVESQSQRFRDEHQRVQSFREGDVLAYPAGVANWVYNNGEVPIVAIAVADTSSNANQLDREHRQFLLAGRERQSQEQSARAEERLQQVQQKGKGNNLLSGFELELLAEALGVDKEVVRKIQNLNDNRGDIVRVERGLQMLEPQRRAEQQELAQEQEQEQEQERSEGTQEERRGSSCQRNGLEETYCTLKNRQNIANPTLADYYNPRAGRLTTLNFQKLPILRFIQLSAERGVLRRNAIQPPHWNINAHSIMYVVRGSGRVQVVGHRGRTVFDGELRQGQLLVIPQQHIVIKKSLSERFEWISFKTNANALMSHIAGKASLLRGIPVEVLMNSYRISREEARRLKFNRGNEVAIFSPRQEREQQGSVLNSVKELITGVFMA